DAYVLAEFLRTDHAHLRALEPNSAEGQELKMLTRDHQRLGRQKTRLLNQIGITLKEYYPVPLEVFESLDTKIALDFLKAYPTPQALSKLTRRGWKRFAKRDHHLSEARCSELWDKLNKPQLAVPAHVVRAKANGKSRIVQFRFACNKHLRQAMYWFSFNSLQRSEWAKKYYRNQRAKGHSKHESLRALGAKWLKIIFVMWRDHKPYDENYHLANIARQMMRQAA